MAPDQEKAANSWKEGARDAFDTAEKLYTSKKYHHALFFCHLAVEKALKATYILAHNEMPPYTHHNESWDPKSIMNLVLINTINGEKKLHVYLEQSYFLSGRTKYDVETEGKGINPFGYAFFYEPHLSGWDITFAAINENGVPNTTIRDGSLTVSWDGEACGSGISSIGGSWSSNIFWGHREERQVNSDYFYTKDGSKDPSSIFHQSMLIGAWTMSEFGNADTYEIELEEYEVFTRYSNKKVYDTGRWEYSGNVLTLVSIGKGNDSLFNNNSVYAPPTSEPYRVMNATKESLFIK